MVSFGKAAAAIASTNKTTNKTTTPNQPDNEVKDINQYHEMIRVEFPLDTCANGNHLAVTKEFMKRYFSHHPDGLTIISIDKQQEFDKAGQCPTTEDKYRTYFTRAVSKYQRAKDRLTITIKTRSTQTLNQTKNRHPTFLDWLKKKDIYTFPHEYKTTALTNIGWLYGAHPTFQSRNDAAVTLRERIRQYKLAEDKMDADIPPFELVHKTFKDYMTDEDGRKTIETPMMEIRCERSQQVLLDKLLLDSQDNTHMPLYIPYNLKYSHPKPFFNKLVEHCHRLNSMKCIIMAGVHADALTSTLVDLPNALAEHLLNLCHPDAPDTRDNLWIHTIEGTQKSDLEGKWLVIVYDNYYKAFQDWFNEYFCLLYAKSDVYDTVRSLYPAPRLESNFPLQQEQATWLLAADDTVVPTTVVTKKQRVHFKAKAPTPPGNKQTTYAQATNGHKQQIKRKTTEETATLSDESELTDRWTLLKDEIEAETAQQINAIECKINAQSKQLDNIQDSHNKFEVQINDKFDTMYTMITSLNTRLSKCIDNEVHNTFPGADTIMTAASVTGNKHTLDHEDAPQDGFTTVSYSRKATSNHSSLLLTAAGPTPGRSP